MNIYCDECPAHTYCDEYKDALEWAEAHKKDKEHYGYTIELPED